MLKNITIENFRCFKHTKISGFSTVNLIGGQNNSGKSMLLEAILLTLYPIPETITILLTLRDERARVIETDNERVWDNFFYKNEKKQEIILRAENDNGEFDIAKITCTNDFDENYNKLSVNLNIDKDLMFRNIAETYILNLEGKKGNEKFNYLIYPNKKTNGLETLGKSNFLGEGVIPFMPSSYSMPLREMVKLYSDIKYRNEVEGLNSVLRIIDQRIVGSEIDAPGGGEAILKLVLNDGQRYALSAFGDAVRKVTVLVLLLLNSSDSIILIDEIENGIHYTKHTHLWKKIFEIAKELKIQVFATSHSLEMIRAFNEVAINEKFADDAKYFEMARNAKTNEIFASAMDMDDLHYEITKNQTFRGE
jgi:AAA15 family ATPase/GTPase